MNIRTLLFLALSISIAGCSSDSQVASRNLSQAADNFEIERRIVFYNGITDKYMLTIQGRCSVEVDVTKNKLDVTCKTGPHEYKKHFLGLSDNVTYFAEQVEGADVSVYHYSVIFKPQSIMPDVIVKGSASDLESTVLPRGSVSK
jgi:hypothetical protein